MRCEWEPAKDTSNWRRHGLSFDEASELFKSGVDYLDLYEEEHFEEEERSIAFGPIRRGIIVAANTEREEDVLRIVSARTATRRARQRYERFEGERYEN